MIIPNTKTNSVYNRAICYIPTISKNFGTNIFYYENIGTQYWKKKAGLVWNTKPAKKK